MDLKLSFKEFSHAAQFLTRLPFDPEHDAAALRRSPGLYGAVGLMLGGLLAVVWLGSGAIWPPTLAALLTVGVGLLLTGALHEDGFADLCDGLGGARGDREKALMILRDSRIGAYGAIGIGMALAVKVAALAALGPWAGAAALIGAAVVSRAAMVEAMAAVPYARETGAGSAVAGPMALNVLALSQVTAALVALVVWPFVGFLGGLWAVGLAALALYGMRALYERRLGGWTGDCLGAVQVAVELAFLCGVAAGA